MMIQMIQRPPLLCVEEQVETAASRHPYLALLRRLASLSLSGLTATGGPCPLTFGAFLWHWLLLNLVMVLPTSPLR